MRRVYAFVEHAMLLAGIQDGGAEEEVQESNVIGMAKIVSHPALDAVEKGIMDELGEQGYEFEYDLQNANGDMTTASQIATKFKNDEVRQATQSLVNRVDVIYVSNDNTVVSALPTHHRADFEGTAASSSRALRRRHADDSSRPHKEGV